MQDIPDDPVPEEHSPTHCLSLWQFRSVFN